MAVQNLYIVDWRLENDFCSKDSSSIVRANYIYEAFKKKYSFFLSSDSYFDKLKNYKITSILIAFAI